jgi:hypothetical protein
MEEDPDSDMLSGTPATQEVVQQTVFVNTGPVIPVQKNVGAQVIGWFVVVYGGFILLGSLFSMTDIGVTDFAGNPITTSVAYKATTLISGLIAAGLYFVGGFKMTKYEKKGIWLIFAGLGISWISGVIAQTFLVEAMEEGMGAIAGATTGVCGLFCAGICGLIVAIPLMLSDGGME